MDFAGLKDKVLRFVQKYKFAAILLAIGIVLMLIPTKEQTAPSVTQPKEEADVQDLGCQLSQLLSAIEGAGNVQVLLTVKSGERIVYQQNTQSSESGIQRVETVIITDSDRNEGGLVSQVDSPVYLGALVVCQGAESASVRLAIVEAVSTVTGLGADRISVQKMK